ncbi:MAG TPA: hypothetical protein VJR89_22220 [Polyangiales bacterium]|nr:hypothetical protein [Polyangiales bacterium]
MRRASAYRVFLTRNSEYHVESHVCVGVRDRRTGLWLSDHPALQRALLSAVAANGGSLQAMYSPCLGERLEFDVDGLALRTSAVLDIEERDARGTMPRPVVRRRRTTTSESLTR